MFAISGKTSAPEKNLSGTRTFQNPKLRYRKIVCRLRLWLGQYRVSRTTTVCHTLCTTIWSPLSSPEEAAMKPAT